MSENICNFCDKSFSTKSSLNRHQRTTKSCLVIQVKIDPNIVNKVTYDCNFCEKQLTTKTNLDYHLGICKVKRGKESQRDKEIQELKLLVQKLATQPKSLQTIINNHYNPQIINNQTNIFNPEMSITSLPKDWIINIFKNNYKSSDILGGATKLATFTTKYIINIDGKYQYWTTDRSRNKLKYFNKEGTFEEDPWARDLAKIILIPEIKTFLREMYEIEMTNVNPYNDVPSNDVIEKACKIRESYREIIDIYSQANEADRKYGIKLGQQLPTIPKYIKQINKAEKILSCVEEDSILIKKPSQPSIEVVFEESSDEDEDEDMPNPEKLRKFDEEMKLKEKSRLIAEDKWKQEQLNTRKPFSINSFFNIGHSDDD